MGVTNQQLYDLIMETVLPEVREICTHLATLNGEVAAVKERTQAHSRDLGEIPDLRERLAILETTKTTHGKELDRARDERRVTLAKVYQVGKEVATWGAIITAVTKVVGLW